MGTYAEKLDIGGACEFFLAGLSILTTGETWYNRLGYKSTYYEKEVEHNKRIIKKPFLSFMKNDIRKIANSIGWNDDYFPAFDKMIKDCTLFVKQSELQKMTVKDFFTIVQKKLRNKTIDCKDKESLLAVMLFKAIEDNGAFVTNGWNGREPDNIIIFRTEKNEDRIYQYKYLN